MTKKLKPCAHCGKEGHIRVRDDIWLQPANFEPHCDTYGCQGSVGLAYGTEEAAVESWNTRTPEIVRCAECRFFEKESELELVVYNFCGRYAVNKKPEDFCSWGERREEK